MEIFLPYLKCQPVQGDVAPAAPREVDAAVSQGLPPGRRPLLKVQMRHVSAGDRPRKPAGVKAELLQLLNRAGGASGAVGDDEDLQAGCRQALYRRHSGRAVCLLAIMQHSKLVQEYSFVFQGYFRQAVNVLRGGSCCRCRCMEAMSLTQRLSRNQPSRQRQLLCECDWS